MKLLARESAPVDYYREGGVVEFDALRYAEDVVSLVKRTMETAGTKALRGMAFTGQAETLVVLGAGDEYTKFKGVSEIKGMLTARAAV